MADNYLDITEPRWNSGPFSSKVTSKVPQFTMGELYLIGWALLKTDPLELQNLPRRIFHPGIFSIWLRLVLFVNFGRSKDAIWQMRPRFLINVVAQMLKYKAKRPRRAVLRYLEVVERLGLLEIDKEGRYWTVRFPDEDEYIDTLANMKRELEARYWDKQAGLHFAMLIQKGNVKPWASFFPNRNKMKPNTNGRVNLAYEKAIPMTARRWSSYSWTILTEHFAAIETGAADHNPYSTKPDRRKETRCGTVVDNGDDLDVDRQEVEDNIQEAVEATKPGRETWNICHETGARLMGISRATYKRRLSHGIMVTRIPQAIKLGKPVHVSDLDRVMAPFVERYEAGTLSHVPRLQPVDRDMFCLQWDRPNKYRYRKGYQNWVLVEAPVELQVGEGAFLRELDGTEGTRETVKTTVHDPPKLPGEFLPKVKVLKSNVVVLEHVPPELQDPVLWAEVEAAGLDVFPSPYKKKVRVPLRGSHRKGERLKKGSALRSTKDLDAKERNRVNAHTRKRRIEDQARRERARERASEAVWNQYDRLNYGTSEVCLR